MRERSLSKRQQQCLDARRHHMTAKEIGRLLNISHNTVAMHWRLARLKLRSMRDPVPGEDDAAPVPSEKRAQLPQGRGDLEWSSLLAAILLLFAAWMSLLFILSACSVMLLERLR
jgi:hypothetical protein